MKKILFVILLGFSTLSQAQYYHGYRGGWVAPALVGGVIGYELARPYYTPPPSVVYVQPSPVYVQQAVPAVPYGYHYQQVVDQTCNCYKMALVPN